MYVADVNLFTKIRKDGLNQTDKTEISWQISVLPQGGSVKQRFVTRVAH